MISKIFLKNYMLDRYIIVNDDKYSFKELKDLVTMYIALLKSKNISKNSKVLILLNNSIEFISLLVAIADIEAILVPINYTQPNISSFLKLGIDLIITKKSLQNNLDYDNIVYLDQVSLNNKISIQGIESKEDYILTMTSGSTSDPKPIIFTQKTKIDRIHLSIQKIYDITNNDTILVSTPMYHSLAQRLVLTSLVLGTNLVILDKFTPNKFLSSIEKYKVTFSIAVSTQLQSMLFLLDKYNLSSLKTLVSSSALLKDDIKDKYLSRLENFHEMYGASEIGTATNLYPYDTNTNSVGKALNHVDIKIIKDNKELKDYEVGEIACKTDTLFKGYYNLPKITKQSFYKEKYFLTGDLGYLDSNKFLYFKGRSKELITVGGSLIFPKDIEDVILEVYGVKECVVVGIDDNYFGEAILAIIVPDENFNIIKVKKRCLNTLSDIQLPMRYEVISELPKNSMGKVMKFKLKEKFNHLNLSKKFKNIG